MRAALRSLPRAVWLIGLISLVNDSASDMVYPLVPLYLSSVLMAGPRALGLIEGLAEATAALLKLFSGVLVDRTHRARPWVVLGYGLPGFGRPLLALVSSWQGLLVIRLADRIGKGLRTSPRDVMLAGSVPASQRGLAFGVQRALDNAGAVVGPLMAATLLGAGCTLQQVFAWSLLPALLCLDMTLALKEPVPSDVPARQPADAPRWQWGGLPAGFRRYLLVVALFTLGNSSNMFLLLRARELGVPAAQVPLLWGLVSVVAMLGAAPLSAWSDRVGRHRLLVGGYVAYGLVYGALAWQARAGWALWALFAAYGLFLAATEGVEKALVADLAEPGQAGTAYGWFNLTAGAMLLPASWVFGLLYEGVSAGVAFGFGAACAMGAAALMAWWVPHRRAVGATGGTEITRASGATERT